MVNVSRIGNLPIQIPQGVTVEATGIHLVVNGPKGKLDLVIHPLIDIQVKLEQIIVKRKNEQKQTKALHGLMRSLVANMITGVTSGFSKNLELIGVGFRAQTDGKKLTLQVGFSHPVEVSSPETVQFEVYDNTKIKVSGIDKQLVGQIAAGIRKIKPPEVYKGKGIRYEGEMVRKKAGKAGKVGIVTGG